MREPATAHEDEALAYLAQELDVARLVGVEANEHDLALGIARDAVTAGIERMDVQPDQRDRNSRQCGALCFSRVPRASSVKVAWSKGK